MNFFGRKTIYLIILYCFFIQSIYNTTQHDLVFWKKSTILDWFWCVESESVFRFFPACLVPEIFLNTSSKNTENALVEWFQKRKTRYFSKTKVHVVSLVVHVIFKTIFGVLFAPLVCLKSINQEMFGSFKSVHKEYCDLMLWKDFLGFKNYVLKVKLSNEYKNGHQKLFARKAANLWTS
jgi:hypothetical protein